jgi:hypothetical protein
LLISDTSVQQHYGNQPQDTEWGVKQGKLFLLQARPITTLSDEKPRQMDEFDKPCRPDDFITTCNAQEMFPGPMTPVSVFVVCVLKNSHNSWESRYCFVPSLMYFFGFSSILVGRYIELLFNPIFSKK